ncbi:TolC family protein [Deltaproteobacteria bacterium TL4]
MKTSLRFYFRWTGFLLVGLFLVLEPSISKSEEKPVTLQTLLEEALEHNPNQKIAGLMVQDAQTESSQARSWGDPELMLELGMKSSVSFSQMLPYWGESDAMEQAAQAGVQAAQKNEDQEKLQLQMEVKRTCYEIWKLAEVLELLKENQEVIERLATLGTADMKDSGTTLQSVLKAQAQAGQNAYDLVLTSERLISAKVRLNTLLGRDSTSLIGAVEIPSAPVFNKKLEEVVNLVLQKNPELAQIEAQRSQTRSRAESAKARNYFPAATLGVTYSQDAEKTDTMLKVGLNLPFLSSRNPALTQQAQLTDQMAVLRYQQKNYDLRQEATQMYYQVLNAQRLKILFQESLLPQAERSYAVAEQAFRAQQQEAMAVLETRNVLLNFRISYVQAQVDYLKALAELEALSGGHL